MLFLRLTLGGIFIAASLGKISNPDNFVSLVTSYNILPENLAQLFGVFLPWIELIIGSLLILGVFSRLASGISMALTASFIVANFCSLACGTGASCGCF
ncbi:MAG: DoxX family membrane protein, partial [Dehalococcoidales bacterium]|nr:DoxX family membrane protein [Dehalococcoidales bacterium]